MAGSWRRFVVEAVFLAGLAVAAGLADLSTGEIIGVMALGWLLTALVELVAWLAAARHPTGVAVSTSPVVPSEPPVSAGAEPEPPPAEPDAADTGEHEAVGQPPAGRRKRFWRRGPAPEADAQEPESHSQQPSHVRLIPRPEPDGTDTPAATADRPAERAEGA